MKVSELRPCDKCHGRIAPHFYVVRLSQALIRPAAINQFMGMHQFFGGRASMALVENFAPEADKAAVVFGDDDPTLMTELYLCQDCVIGGAIDLAMLIEADNARKRKAEARSVSQSTTPEEP